MAAPSAVSHLHHVAPCFDDATAERIAKMLTETPGAVLAGFKRH